MRRFRQTPEFRQRELFRFNSWLLASGRRELVSTYHICLVYDLDLNSLVGNVRIRKFQKYPDLCLLFKFAMDSTRVLQKPEECVVVVDG